MPGKGHIPDLTERIVRTLKANTNRSAGGLGSNAAPSLVRDRLAASRRGSNVVATERRSKVDQFTITGDSEDVFTLTHAPIADSWNVTMGFPFHRDRFTITGRTLTITDPTDTFRGVADNGDRTLEVEYDYYAGVPVVPSAEEIIGTGQTSREISPSNSETFYALDYDDSAWTPRATDEIAYYHGSFPPQTYLWANASLNLQVRCYVTATPGSPVTLTYGVDDTLDVYWNGALLFSEGAAVPSDTYVISGDLVFGNNLLAIRAGNSLSSSCGVVVTPS